MPKISGSFGSLFILVVATGIVIFILILLSSGKWYTNVEEQKFTYIDFHQTPRIYGTCLGMKTFESILQTRDAHVKTLSNIPQSPKNDSPQKKVKILNLVEFYMHKGRSICAKPSNGISHFNIKCLSKKGLVCSQKLFWGDDMRIS